MIMNKQLLVVILFVITMLEGCSNFSIKRQLQEIIGTEVIFPSTLEPITRNSVMQNHEMKPIKLLLYNKSENCLSCAIAKLGQRLEIQGLLHEKSMFEFSIIHAFSSRQYDVEKKQVENLKCNWNIYLDSDYSFLNANPKILENEIYHIMLLDRYNRIVLVGNPMANASMWNLFKSTLENMLTHDGEYGPEN